MAFFCADGTLLTMDWLRARRTSVFAADRDCHPEERFALKTSQ